MKCLLIISSFILLLFTTSCRKSKPVKPVDKLPAETQTGANTFGCLVNGEVFKPGGASLSGGSLNAVYQQIILGTPSGYTFGVSAKNQKENCLYKTIAFGFDSISMKAGMYQLGERKNGQGGGAYQEFPCNQDFKEYTTSRIITGQLNLKRFDETNQIVSGTFWFDAVNASGQKVEVREGRFDVRYTR